MDAKSSSDASPDFANNQDRDKFHQAGSAAELDAEDKFVTFERWLSSSGTKLPKLELRDYGEEVRGCHAKEDVYDEEVIIEVPLKCLITVEMGKETHVGKAILSSRIELDAPKHIFLMIFMLLDRKKADSFFQPYYDILPETLSNMPIFWDAGELKFLEGSYMLEQVDERNVAIEADYLSICNVCPEFRSISTLHEFKWARMCVCSRNFGLVVNGLQTAAMVPYADMLNHYRPRETKWQFDDAVQGFTVVALQRIGMGAQVYDSYGRKCNHRFLLNYGFSVENNTESDGFCPNEVPILLEIGKTDPLFDVKCTFYRRDLSIPYRRIRVCVSDNENTKLLLAMLRVIVADKEDFDLLVSCAGNSLYRSLRDAQVAVSIKNESRVMGALVATCGELLSHYPTSFAHDVERLSNPDSNIAPFSNERHALIQVKGEKEVLLFLQDLGSTSASLLQIVDGAKFEQQLEQVRCTKHALIYQYARGTIARLHQDEVRRAENRRRKLDLSRPTVV
ncbi:hypothetical protein B484DRAFT_396031 [Ochromonadaceae sp. CCMP2298]|nr:hypothetical protein B484DRAFT_396031 [Ochromonadaceae sp. CCMP2298]|mmetsp:Transcript_2940/g.6809  ORF Transcript_2940/g.6809 Transcript_2940/m.6809 type:complete len:507 (+) Transcript_2940:315-1835(+)|eukprot:CAMPEP_0173183602 /NCGR_PEP_ID=MMETSP1141-20130122/8484_1 /TAXON_ID=483371 /ORGANISM="non described non described, Strain CCMP2298" /LENGTH=506 /DNA_ID=CAMNT_0014106825 /DNA_START=235 /DNA_END=1755 /DNA_ORIENTATION=+